MTLNDTVRALLAGERCDAVLHNCRLEAFGGEHFGQEAIREQFRTQPHELSDGAIFVETPELFAVFDDVVALVADRYDGRFGRLWRLGPGGPVAVEPRIDVAFDADLQQARGDLLWRAEDHPQLDPRHHCAVALAARQMLDADQPDERAAYRGRAFLVRACGQAGSAAALFAVHRLSGDAVRTAGFAYAAALVSGGRTQLVRDRVGEAAMAARGWRPRL